MKYRIKEGNYCSDECVADTIIFPNRNHMTCAKEALQFGYDSIVAMFFDKDNFKLTSSDMSAITDSFKDIDKTDINSWINTIQTKYPNVFTVYRIPARLTGWRYADASRWSANYMSRTHDSYYDLCIYDRNHCNSQIEQNILDLQFKMSLLDYLKGGKDV
jgi:hypothetical protein